MEPFGPGAWGEPLRFLTGRTETVLPSHRQDGNRLAAPGASGWVVRGLHSARYRWRAAPPITRMHTRQAGHSTALVPGTHSTKGPEPARVLARAVCVRPPSPLRGLHSARILPLYAAAAAAPPPPETTAGVTMSLEESRGRPEGSDLSTRSEPQRLVEALKPGRRTCRAQRRPQGLGARCSQGPVGAPPAAHWHRINALGGDGAGGGATARHGDYKARPGKSGASESLLRCS
jgi:hypothetical protein